MTTVSPNDQTQSLEDFVFEHFVPSETPSILDPSEWAVARDFLCTASTGGDTFGRLFSPFTAYTPASPVLSTMSFDSMDSSFDPCASWPFGNGTPFEHRFASVVAAPPGENWNSVPVSDPLISAPSSICEITAVSPCDLGAGLASVGSPSASTAMSVATTDSEWEPSRRLKQSLREQPLSPRAPIPRRNSYHQSCKAQALGKSAYYLKRELAAVEKHGRQLFGADMCDQCRESPAKLDCIHKPGMACTSCIRNRRKDMCSLRGRAVSAEHSPSPTLTVVSVESSPTPVASAVDTLQHTFAVRPSGGTMAGTRLALAEVLGDIHGLQRQTAAVATAIQRLLESLSSSSF